MADIPLGQIERYTIHMEPMGVSNLSSCNWKLLVWSKNRILIPKTSCILQTEDSYDFFVDTTRIGVGNIYIQLVIELLDMDYDKGYRPQMPIIDTEDRVVLNPIINGNMCTHSHNT